LKPIFGFEGWDFGACGPGLRALCTIIEVEITSQGQGFVIFCQTRPKSSKPQTPYNLETPPPQVGDLTMNKAMKEWHPLRLRQSEQPIGELYLEVLLKKLPEFFVQTQPRSKSIDYCTPFVSPMTGMVVSPKDYVLERKFSMGATGIAFDFESTSLLLSDQANQEEDELQIMWEEEQERRRKFDQQRSSELRAAAVDSNMRKVPDPGPKPKP
jgi:hypothetical protein